MSSMQIVTSKTGTLSVSAAGDPNVLSGYQPLGSTICDMASLSYGHGSIPTPFFLYIKHASCSDALLCESHTSGSNT